MGYILKTMKFVVKLKIYNENAIYLEHMNSRNFGWWWIYKKEKEKGLQMKKGPAIDGDRIVDKRNTIIVESTWSYMKTYTQLFKFAF